MTAADRQEEADGPPQQDELLAGEEGGAGPSDAPGDVGVAGAAEAAGASSPPQGRFARLKAVLRPIFVDVEAEKFDGEAMNGGFIPVAK